MVMHSLFRNSPSLPAIVQRLFDLATWLIARSLQMPEPLLQSAAVFVFAQAQAFENSFGKSLCSIRLFRRVRARPSGALTCRRSWLMPAFDPVMLNARCRCISMPASKHAMPNLASLVASEDTLIVTLHHGCVQRDRRMVEMSAEETMQGKRACEHAPRSSALAENRAGGVTFALPGAGETGGPSLRPRRGGR
jgi:hypothetical protein